MSSVFFFDNGSAPVPPSGFYPVILNGSLRLNDNDSAYLSRTYITSSTVTVHCRVKRCNIGTSQPILGAEIRFNSDDTITAFGSTTTSVFRDVSSWYNITVSNSGLVVNGYNYSSITTSTITNSSIGTDGANYADIYISDFYLIDGQSLSNTEFEELKSGVWVPKAYTGSYGANGFHLPLSSDSLDDSGNGNDWTENNLASTDYILDNATNNWCTLNPAHRGGEIGEEVSEGNLKYDSGVDDENFVCGTHSVFAGKWVFEFKVNTGDTHGELGFTNIDNLNQTTSVNFNPEDLGIGGFLVPSLNRIRINGVTTNISISSINSVFRVELDADTGFIEFFEGSTSLGSGTITGITNYTPVALNFSGTSSRVGRCTLNFGQDSSFAGQETRQGNTDANGIGDFYHAPSSGHLAICASNIAETDITPLNDDIPEDYFQSILDTGTSIKTASESVFTNQLAWIKDRANVNNHQLMDSVRGLSNVLQSNTTAAETTYSAPIGNSVSWVWDCLNTGVSNTDGSVTSTVAANIKSGFSIVTATLSGASATIGHGLPTTPVFIVGKRLDSTSDWPCYHVALGSSDVVYLNTTAASVTDLTVWDSTDPTSTVFSVGTSLTGDWAFYVFAEVDGYSRFGSYSGNGLSDGTFTYHGFSTALSCLKRTDSTSNWTLLDNTREGYNIDNDPLYPNLSSAEGGDDLADILSNGVKLRSTDVSINASGGDYIYWAFAEMPFKYANAR